MSKRRKIGREDMLKEMFKIGLISFMILVLTGCSRGQVNNEPNEVTPTTSVSEEQNAGGKNEDTNTDGNDNQSLTGPEGDLADPVVIAIDAGHGGGFAGASYDGRNEKDLTLQMAFYVKEYIEENYSGAEIHLVREKDAALSGDVKEDLELRAKFASDVNADVLVSLHFNASDTHDQSGAMVFISNRDHVTEASKSLGEKILVELESLGLTNRGTQTRNSNDMFDENGKALDYYAVNRHSAAINIPGIIVEHCFMDHSGDQQFIDSEEDLKALAKADAIGIANYFGLSKK